MLCSPLLARAGLSDTIDRIKPSIVVVGTNMLSRAPNFELRGTGFVVGDGTLVATNAHVAGVPLDAERFETLAILCNVGGRQQVREARVLASVPEHDLALLKIQGDALPALPLGDSSGVREGQAIAFTGFPIGSVLGFTPVTHRGIVSAITPIVIPVDHISQLNTANRNRLARGGFPVFQLDATAYPGNSGSPVYDLESGEVLGIINMVLVKAGKESVLAQPSGISYAIPVSHLVDMIAARR
ncbi:MAG: serine protease [Gammaproteobacteria bacterium]|jgi:serine protease Do|nr:serine protease [Gammaproteobacteria bacterium]MBU0770770.1 serine protease [Gammaproteobacteria bacterium]MBU0856752.1 serine protease [Gammaproteobacteria bacterium]MBU1845567.1 serine protease [Gammaproteobacteria bacterium]